MKPDKNDKLDELLFEALTRESPRFDFDTWKKNHQKEIDIFKSQADSRQILQPAGFWRTIMKSKITKLAAAAGIVIILMLLVMTSWHHIDITSKAYAMTDVPELFRNAKTLHTQAWRWIYDSDPNNRGFFKANVVPIEHWIDIANIRMHAVSFMSYRPMSGELHVDPSEYINDRQDQISIDHKHRKVWFSKPGVLHNRLENLQLVNETILLACPAQVDGYRNVGTETIDGCSYDIWERQGFWRDTQVKVRCWLSPSNGNIARLYQWLKPHDCNEWLPDYFLEKVERDVEIPDEIFAFTVPDGYRQESTRETAPVSKTLEKYPMQIEGVTVEQFRYSFTLSDGSVIVAWRSWLHEDEPQEQLFANLTPGSQLPNLPAVLEKLIPAPSVKMTATDVSYRSCHLAFTRKQGHFVEWALYVPEVEVPPLLPNCAYECYYRVNGAKELVEKKLNPVWGPVIRPEGFDTFVGGAMAELNDGGSAPKDVTYENTMRLAQEIRQSVGKSH